MSSTSSGKTHWLATTTVLLGRRWRRIFWTIGLGLLLLWSMEISDVAPSQLFDKDGWRSAKDLISGFSSPDLSHDFLHRVLKLMAESIAIGMLGMVLAVFIAVPLALLAARYPCLEDEPGRQMAPHALFSAVRFCARMVLAFFRSIPEIIWAFLFVRILGLGPGPAVLAIGLTFGGIIGKLYADLLEACDPGPVRVLRAGGAGPIGVVVFGLLPQVRNQWIGYALFRFECAVRSASILGIVGAGGIGAEIDLSIRYFQYDKLATALLAVLACIIVLEALSVFLRRTSMRLTLVLTMLGAWYGFTSLKIPWSALWSSNAWEQTERFIGGFLSPNTEGAFLHQAWGMMLETFGMALCGTALAALLAFLLAPMATRMLTVRGFLEYAPVGRGISRPLLWACLLIARLLLQVLRALPDLVFAVVFVVWVGPGPFAGVLAITAHTTGILGRLFCEVYEEVEPGPPRNLERIGITAFGRWAYGVLPQVRARLAAYALFRFEVNIRTTAMMGFVGAGGIGNAIHTAISLFHMSDLASLLVILLITVAAVDIMSSLVRRALLRTEQTAPDVPAVAS